jgi:hypothetical protein
MTFDEVLDAIGILSEEQQVNLLQVVRQRLAAKGRQRIVADMRAARADHQAGLIRATSVDELMREIE